jgi:hypothetical protein
MDPLDLRRCGMASVIYLLIALKQWVYKWDIGEDVDVEAFLPFCCRSIFDSGYRVQSPGI